MDTSALCSNPDRGPPRQAPRQAPCHPGQSPARGNGMPPLARDSFPGVPSSSAPDHGAQPHRHPIPRRPETFHFRRPHNLRQGPAVVCNKCFSRGHTRDSCPVTSKNYRDAGEHGKLKTTPDKKPRNRHIQPPESVQYNAFPQDPSDSASDAHPSESHRTTSGASESELESDDSLRATRMSRTRRPGVLASAPKQSTIPGFSSFESVPAPDDVLPLIRALREDVVAEEDQLRRETKWKRFRAGMWQREYQEEMALKLERAEALQPPPEPRTAEQIRDDKKKERNRAMRERRAERQRLAREEAKIEKEVARLLLEQEVTPELWEQETADQSKPAGPQATKECRHDRRGSSVSAADRNGSTVDDTAAKSRIQQWTNDLGRHSSGCDSGVTLTAPKDRQHARSSGRARPPRLKDKPPDSREAVLIQAKRGEQCTGKPVMSALEALGKQCAQEARDDQYRARQMADEWDRSAPHYSKPTNICDAPWHLRRHNFENATLRVQTTNARPMLPSSKPLQVQLPISPPSCSRSDSSIGAPLPHSGWDDQAPSPKAEKTARWVSGFKSQSPSDPMTRSPLVSPGVLMHAHCVVDPSPRGPQHLSTGCQVETDAERRAAEQWDRPTASLGQTQQSGTSMTACAETNAADASGQANHRAARPKSYRGRKPRGRGGGPLKGS
ncbi:unnamed protein product [Parajaminaea phylloscopi]